MSEQPCFFHPNRLTAVSCSRCGRPICPDDMISAPVGIHCPICSGRMREGALGAAQYRARVRTERWPLVRIVQGASVTKLLLLANVAVFVAMLATGTPTAAKTLVRFGALIAPLPRGEWWRLFTSMFVHIGVAHLLFNMFALLIFGPAVEERYGKARYVALYLGSGLLAGSASLALTPGGIRAGASGAIFGILGAWIGFYLRHRKAPGAAGQLRSLVFFVGINLLIGWQLQYVDVNAHLGGLAAGLVLALGMELAATARSGMRRGAGAAAYAAVIAVSVILILPHVV